MIIKMRRHHAGNVICRILYRRKGAHLLAVGKDDYAAGMLSSGTPYLRTAHGKPLYLSLPHPYWMGLITVILVISQHVAIGCLILHRAYGTGLVGLPLSEQHLRIGVGLRLVISGKIKVYIRLLITLKSKEGLKRYVKTVLYELRPAHRAVPVRHVVARPGAVLLYYIRVKVRKMALRTPVMRRQRIDLGNASKGGRKGRSHRTS